MQEGLRKVCALCIAVESQKKVGIMLEYGWKWSGRKKAGNWDDCLKKLGGKLEMVRLRLEERLDESWRQVCGMLEKDRGIVSIV